MDDTLTILSLEPMRMVTKLNRKSLRALEKSGHHNVPKRIQDVSGVFHSALCVSYVKRARNKQRKRDGARV